MNKKAVTRIDVFANIDEVIKFWEFAKARGLTPESSREEMAAALAAYKKPDGTVKGHKEHIEAKLAKKFRAPIIEFKKER